MECDILCQNLYINNNDDSESIISYDSLDEIYDEDLYDDLDEEISCEDLHEDYYECSKCGPNVNCQTYKQTGYDCYGKNSEAQLSPSLAFTSMDLFLRIYNHGKFGPCRCKNIDPKKHICGIINIKNEMNSIYIILAEYLDEIKENSLKGNLTAAWVLKNFYKICPELQ